MRRRPKCLNWVTEKSAASEACFPSCQAHSTEGSEDKLQEVLADLKSRLLCACYEFIVWWQIYRSVIWKYKIPAKITLVKLRNPLGIRSADFNKAQKYKNLNMPFYSIITSTAATNESFYYWFVVCSVTCQKIVKNGHHNFPKPKLTYSDCMSCPTNSPKPKEIQFADIEDQENQEILTSENQRILAFLKTNYFTLFNHQNCLFIFCWLLNWSFEL